jgi:hypothetical protein
MEISNNKLELTIGFTALIVSLGTFKSELQSIMIDLGIFKFSLDKYLLLVILALLLSAYLTYIDKISKEFQFGGWRVFNILPFLSTFLLVFVLVSPFLIMLLYPLNKLNNYMLIHKSDSDAILFVLRIFAFILATLATISSALYHLKFKKIQSIEKNVDKEIIEIEYAKKLYSDKYYAHSVLEFYKILVAHLYNNLQNQGVRISKNRVDDLINQAEKNGLISLEDVEKIKTLRIMRNKVAHSSKVFTEEEAQNAMDFVIQLINKT